MRDPLGVFSSIMLLQLPHKLLVLITENLTTFAGTPFILSEHAGQEKQSAAISPHHTNWIKMSPLHWCLQMAQDIQIYLAYSFSMVLRWSLTATDRLAQHTALTVAASGGHTDTMELLMIQNGTDILSRRYGHH